MVLAGLKLRGWALGAALSMILAACTGGPSGGGALTVGVSSPKDGAQVSIPFRVTVTSNVAIGPPESGNHHVHLYFDVGKDSGDYQLVYSNTVQVTRQLTPGKHTIIASLRNPDHSDAGPSVSFTVTVTGSASGSGSGSAAPSPTSSGPNY